MANYKLLTSNYEYEKERRDHLSFKQHKTCKYFCYRY